MVSLFSRPDESLLKMSYGTVWSCRYTGDAGLQVVDLAAIKAVVALVPHPLMAGNIIQEQYKGHYYVVEKLGLDVLIMAGTVVDDHSEDSDNNVSS